MKNKILLFVSIVMFISANTYSQGNIFTLSNGKKVEIAEKVSSERMCYGAALKLCNNLGVGWRIPTAEEQKELSLNKDKIGGYVETEKNLYAEGYRSAWYYTSTPRDCYGQEKCVISICISDGSDGTAGTETNCFYWVRPIRDYNSISTNSSPNNSQTSNNSTTTNSPATDRYGNKVNNNSTSVSNTTNTTPSATTPKATTTTKTTNTSQSPNVPVDSPWTLQGTTSSKLFKTGTGKYDLKYNSEYGNNIITKNLTRIRRSETNVDAHFMGNPMLKTFGIFAPKEELEKAEPQVPAIIEVCKSNDTDYEYMIVWANIKYGDFPYSNARGYILERSILGDYTSIWFIL